jgi:hypothetical protein
MKPEHLEDEINRNIVSADSEQIEGTTHVRAILRTFAGKVFEHVHEHADVTTFDPTASRDAAVAGARAKVAAHLAENEHEMRALVERNETAPVEEPAAEEPPEEKPPEEPAAPPADVPTLSDVVPGA